MAQQPMPQIAAAAGIPERTAGALTMPTKDVLFYSSDKFVV